MMTTVETNQKYKVLIPTAGIGSRLCDLTKYLNKSLVGVGKKPVISRIIDMFPETVEFVIALGYKGDLVKQFLSLAYPNRHFEFANVEKYEGVGSGLGLTILSCEKLLQEPFVFCSCDTIVTDKIPYPSKNIIGFAKRVNKSQYRTIDINGDKVNRLLEKGLHTDSSMPYIGLAFIHDYETFWNKMHEGNDEAILLGESYALDYFAKEGTLFSQEFNWFDTGNQVELKKTVDYFKEDDAPNILPKANEAIWFVDDVVIKYSDDKKFIRDRVERINYLKEFVPEIIASTENMYAYKKADGYVLSKIADISVFKKLLEFSKRMWLYTALNNEELNDFKKTCENFYYKKTLQRIELYYRKFDVVDSHTEINGIKMPKLSSLLENIDWENIFNGIPSGFHGDFHFENILYDDENDKFTFLDWRQNFGNSLSIGDVYYDLAKLLHGLIICHELIYQDKYSVQKNNNVINYSFDRKPILISCEEYFYKWLNLNNYDVKKVKILTALIYLNIAALHHYPYCHLLYNLGKTMLYENLNITH